MYYHFNMRRDLEAWYQDNSGGNLFRKDTDFDINIPYHFFLQYSRKPIKLKIGRYSQKFGFSPNRGLAVSGSPRYDGLRSSIDFGAVAYQYYFASLNPYLTGAPGSPGEGLPDTEWTIQSSTPLSKQRYRVYDEMSKSLIVQRLSIQRGKFLFAAMESMVMGGKYPAYRDVLPFMMWHNLFQDGYVNEIISVECAYHYSKQFTLYSEVAFDDLVGGTENENTSADIYAILLGSKFKSSFKSGKLNINIEWISTGEKYGSYELPLLNWTSRQIYYSNYRQKDESAYSDVYIIDHPIGYFRGAGSNDIWFDLRWENNVVTILSTLGFLKHIYKNDDSVIEDVETRYELKSYYGISPYLQIQLGGYYRILADDSTVLIPFNNYGLSLGISALLNW